MQLWREWWRWCAPLKDACARNRTFLWMCVVLMAFCVRGDLWGVTSFIRALGLDPLCYDRILDFFHSPALDIQMLMRLWVDLVVSVHPGLVECNGRPVVLVDGLKVARAGKKMPGVKRLHQESESNTKPTFIMGHSCQAAAILVKGLNSVMALPLAARIHEGAVFSNRDKRTLLDKMVLLLMDLKMKRPFTLVADAYYASKKVITPLLKKGCHLVTRVRQTAVGYLPAPIPEKKPKGRPKKYGEKVPIKSLFERDDLKQSIPSPVYGEQNVSIDFWSLDLLWRPVGILVRFVAVSHPTRGRILLLSTDLTLAPIDILRLYSYRFKIEVSFKSAIHVLGAFAYHFWMAQMTPITRNAGNQYLHRKSKEYRDAVRRKLAAYHRYIQLGIIAQGILVALATTVPHLVWSSYGSWLRTVRPGLCPSEATTASALQNMLPHFLGANSPDPDLAKFVQERLDLKQTQAGRLAA